MFRSKTSYRRAVQAAFALCLAVFAGASPAAQFLYTGGHDLEDERIAALGHSYVKFSSTDAGWATALGGGLGPFSAILVGEDYSSSSLSLATSQAIAAYVAGGGRVVVASDHDGNIRILNSVFGYSAVVQYGCGSDENVAATRQSVAAGTSFANGPSTVANLDCTSAFTSASLPALTKKFYQGSVTTLAFGSSYSNGALVWLGWDYCCGGSQEQIDAWYMLLDSALKFAGGSCASQGFTGPKLTLCNSTCAAVPNSLQQRNLITLFTALYRSAPSCPTPPARAPQAVFGGGGD